MDEVDSALHQSPRKYGIRRRHSSVGTRLIKMLSKYRMKLEFRCNCTWIPAEHVLVRYTLMWSETLLSLTKPEISHYENVMQI